jgi:hypothetical protein
MLNSEDRLYGNVIFRKNVSGSRTKMEGTVKMINNKINILTRKRPQNIKYNVIMVYLNSYFCSYRTEHNFIRSYDLLGLCDNNYCSRSRQGLNSTVNMLG